MEKKSSIYSTRSHLVWKSSFALESRTHLMATEKNGIVHVFDAVDIAFSLVFLLITVVRIRSRNVLRYQCLQKWFEYDLHIKYIYGTASQAKPSHFNSIEIQIYMH